MLELRVRNGLGGFGSVTTNSWSWNADGSGSGKRLRIRDVNDSFDASVLLRVLSVGGILGGSWASLEGERKTGGVGGREKTGVGLILTRRGDEKSEFGEPVSV